MVRQSVAILAWTCFCLGLIPATPLTGGEFNPVLKIGDAGPNWQNLPGVDGQQHSLTDLKDKPYVLLVFTCNSCPIARDYEDRLIALTKKYGGEMGKVAVVAVNVNKVPEDSFAKMQERAEKKAFPYAYLFDETQQIAKDYGATFTPEVVLLNSDRKVVYMGGIDDNSDATKVTKHFLDDALTALLKGEVPAVQEAAARGCLVRYERKSRKK